MTIRILVITYWLVESFTIEKEKLNKAQIKDELG